METAAVSNVVHMGKWLSPDVYATRSKRRIWLGTRMFGRIVVGVGERPVDGHVLVKFLPRPARKGVG